MGVAVIYQCNDGPVVYGPFATVAEAVIWCKAREAKPGQDPVEFALAPYYVPSRWEAL